MADGQFGVGGGGPYNPYSISSAASPVSQPSTSEQVLDFLSALGANSPEFARSLRYVQDQLAQNRARNIASAATIGAQYGGFDPATGQIKVPEQVVEERGNVGSFLQSLGVLGQPSPRPITSAERQAAVYGAGQSEKIRAMQRAGDIREIQTASDIYGKQQEAGHLEREDVLRSRGLDITEKLGMGHLDVESERTDVLRESGKETRDLKKLLLKMQGDRQKMDKLFKLRQQKLEKFKQNIAPLNESLKETLKAIQTQGGTATDEQKRVVKSLTDSMNKAREQMGLMDVPVEALIAYSNMETGPGGMGGLLQSLFPGGLFGSWSPQGPPGTELLQQPSQGPEPLPQFPGD